MSPQAWVAEHPVDAALASALVAAQFPELAGTVPRAIGQGWDMDVWGFGELAFRFPRRAMAVPLVSVELAVLPRLAPRLPVPVPAPTHIGRPTEAFPHPFYGHRWLAGTPVERADLDAASRAALAPVLGELLRALHAIDPGAVGAPEDDFKFDMARKAAAARTRMPAIVGAVRPEVLSATEALLAMPPADRRERPGVLLHGDLYLRHLLVDGAGGLAGVIDWGDVRSGDRAIDLAVAYTFLPPAARPAFWRAYGEVDEETRRRARFTGVANHGVSLLAYALDIQDAELAREAALSLSFAVSD